MKINIEELKARLEATANEIAGHEGYKDGSVEATYMRGFCAAMIMMGIDTQRVDGRLTCVASWIED